jgi:hypothetical protein
MSNRELHHGTKPINGLNKVAQGNIPATAGGPPGGGFGRLFNKDPQQPSHQVLIDLGKKGGMMDEGDGLPAADNQTLPLGFVFLGQFVDHDITLDMTSALEQVSNPKKVINVRTATLELDSVYAGGPQKDANVPDRKMYDPSDPDKLRVGTAMNPNDLPRVSSGPDKDLALIGDPRNDESLVTNQIHVAFLKFHNAVVEHVRVNRTTSNVFEEARRQVIWHYQWIVLHDFLPRIIGQTMVDDILQNGLQHYKVKPNHKPYIPVEFSVAAYRYGHSQVRSRMQINSSLQNVALFSSVMTGFKPVTLNEVVDWSHFFDRDSRNPAQRARKIDGKLAGVLFDLPFIDPAVPAEHRSLATRNLLRGSTFQLLSGQKVAQRMQVTALTDAQLGLGGTGLEVRTPLWYYILKEAELQQGGDLLGEVGGRIVGEVLIGLLQEDEDSILNQTPEFTPTLPSMSSGDFTMVDLLNFAGV